LQNRDDCAITGDYCLTLTPFRLQAKGLEGFCSSDAARAISLKIEALPQHEKTNGQRQAHG
jgi:hypothetical protein